jgi:hypothetical protein
MPTKTVLIKVSGSQEGVKEFLAVVNSIFKVAIVGTIKPNDHDGGVHVFIDVDPALTKLEAQTA